MVVFDHQYIGLTTMFEDAYQDEHSPAPINP